MWLNPPYSTVGPWMQALARHGNGIALVFARCETSWWFDHVWPHADGFLFLRGRLNFHLVDGSTSKTGHNSGGPSVLIAYGAANADRLRRCSLPGAWLPAATFTTPKPVDRRTSAPLGGLFADQQES